MLLAFGLGFSARALALRWRERGLRVAATARAPAPAEHAEGIAGAAFGAATPLAEVERLLAEATHVLVSIPPDAGGGEAGDIVLRRLAPALAAARNVVWLGYLSSTGVYGDRAGAWVD